MLPIRELRPEPLGGPPRVVHALIAVNVALFALQLLAPAMTLGYAFVPRTLQHDPAFSLVTIGTSMFLHGGLLHLLSNLLFLWIFGPSVEGALGSRRFAALYLLSGVAAALAQVAFEPLARVPMLGASGAISGVLAAYVSLFPRRRIETLAFVFILPLPALFFVVEWFAMNLLRGVSALSGPSHGVAWWAHIGGFLGGLVLVRLLFPTAQPVGAPPLPAHCPEKLRSAARTVNDTRSPRSTRETFMSGPVVLRSELLAARAVRHGFSTRIGGVSEGPFASLNVAVAPGDRPDHVEENLKRFAAAISVDPERLYQTSQVHGADVRAIGPRDDRRGVVHEHADALIADDPTVAIAVRVADCVPVLIHERDTGVVAAVHAGWRGVVGGVVQSALAHLAIRARGTAGIAAAIGPSIGPCCFEVDEEVASAIADAAPGDDALVLRDRPKPHVDLRRAVRLQLRALGVSDSAIEDVAGCTRCDAERFFSHRRDGARSGRLLAAIAP